MVAGQVGIRDLVKLDVTDGFNPLIDRYFYVNVAQMDVLYPRVVNKGVELKEGGRVALTTGNYPLPDKHRLTFYTFNIL